MLSIVLSIVLAPIVPALARVFEAALAGGGAKSINFQELAADLAEITFKFPFRIPPYFAVGQGSINCFAMECLMAQGLHNECMLCMWHNYFLVY